MLVHQQKKPQLLCLSQHKHKRTWLNLVQLQACSLRTGVPLCSDQVCAPDAACFSGTDIKDR